MTAVELRSILATMLSDLLGTYTRPVGDPIPAIVVGEPDSTYRASGLEIRIAIVPDLQQIPAYNRGALRETHLVRLVSHGEPWDTLAALRKILSRWPTAQAIEIPADPAAHILSQHTISIPA